MLFLCALGLSCLQEPPPPAERVLQVAPWNVENFFDPYDDPWRADEVTRPRYASEGRTVRLAEVLRDLDADVVCLQEVEHRFLLQEFNRQHLADLRYEVVLVEGNDERGIDVALLTRVPVRSVTSHRHLRFQDREGRELRFQRDLLQVRLGPPLNGDVFVVHLKSQHGGDEADAVRQAEADAVASLLRVELERDPGYRAVLAGDFNDVAGSGPLRGILASGMTDPCAGSELPTYNQEPYRQRIDYLLLSPALSAASSNCRIVENAQVRSASDHNPVLLSLRLPQGGG